MGKPGGRHADQRPAQRLWHDPCHRGRPPHFDRPNEDRLLHRRSFQDGSGSALLNTGSAIGVFCNLLPSGSLLPQVVPSFCQVNNGQMHERMDFQQIFTTAATVMARRGDDVHGRAPRLFRGALQQHRGGSTPHDPRRGNATFEAQRLSYSRGICDRSSTTLPSRRRISRCAWAAISGLCVTSRMVKFRSRCMRAKSFNISSPVTVSEIARRLVGQQHTRIVGQGAGDGHPLTFTAGKLRRQMVQAVAHADFRQEHGGAPGGGRRRSESSRTWGFARFRQRLTLAANERLER